MSLHVSSLRSSLAGFVFWFALHAYLVLADLPIHATIHDIHGIWTLYLSTPSAAPQSCGSGTPNRNSDNLLPQLQDYKAWIENHAGGLNRSLILDLTDERSVGLSATEMTRFPNLLNQTLDRPSHRAPWRALNVKLRASISNGPLLVNEKGHVSLQQKLESVGAWTAIYSEGMEISLHNGLILTGFLKYSLSPTERCRHLHPTNSDQENSEGRTECYQTNPSKTSLGWYTFMSNQKPKWGCWYGNKETPLHGRPSLFVSINKNEPKTMLNPIVYRANRLWTSSQPQSPEIPKHALRQFGWSGSASKIGDVSKASFSPGISFLEIEKGQSPYACRDQPIDSLIQSARTLPNIYSSVPTPFDTDSVEFSEIVTQDRYFLNCQGNCGSCYAIASAYVLRARSLIGLKSLQPSETKIDTIPELSFQSVLSCSYINQGCSGGYPFLVGRWASQFGLPPASCQPYLENDAIACASNLTMSERIDNEGCNPSDLVFASDYGYVGGCYECCSEKAMMEEIYHRGPIVAALDVPQQLFKYKDGIFDEVDFHHARHCDEPNRNLNGWEFTNHAIVIVGWGEDEHLIDNKSQTIKYWFIRNSWGPRWGRNGYGKILRGQNLGGIEAQAVFIDPDFTRGRLLRILQNVSMNSSSSRRKNHRQFAIASHQFDT